MNQLDDNNELHEEHEDEEEIGGFASSLGSSFGVEVSEEAITGKAVEKEGEPVDPNYESPHLKSLREALEKIKSGSMSKEDFKVIFDKIEKELETAISNFDLTMEMPPENDNIREMIPSVKEAFENNKKALDTIKIYFDDNLIDHVIHGVGMFQEATNSLNRIFNLITGSLLQTYRKIREVEEGSFIDTVEGKRPEEQVKYTTPNVEKLREGILQVTERKITDDEFKKILEEVEQNITGNIEEVIKEKNKQPKGNKSFLEYVDMAVKALEKTKEGIEEMKSYFVSRNTRNLDAGLEMAYEGAKLMAQAYEFNNKSRESAKK